MIGRAAGCALLAAGLLAIGYSAWPQAAAPALLCDGYGGVPTPVKAPGGTAWCSCPAASSVSARTATTTRRAPPTWRKCRRSGSMYTRSPMPSSHALSRRPATSPMPSGGSTRPTTPACPSTCACRGQWCSSKGRMCCARVGSSCPGPAGATRKARAATCKGWLTTRWCKWHWRMHRPMRAGPGAGCPARRSWNMQCAAACRMPTSVGA